MSQQFVNGMIHVIQKGENLYQLSRKYRVPLALILRANPYVDVYNLRPGQEIVIPTSRPVMPFPGMRPPRPPQAPQPGAPVPAPQPRVPEPRMSEEMSEEMEERAEEMPEENDWYIADGTKSMRQIWQEMGVTEEEFASCNDWDKVIVAADVTLNVPKKV